MRTKGGQRQHTNSRSRQELFRRFCFSSGVLLALALSTILSSCTAVRIAIGSADASMVEKVKIPSIEMEEPDVTEGLQEAVVGDENLNLRGKDVSSLRDPFNPVYTEKTEAEQSIQEDALALRNIYVEDQTKYADIELNGVIYKLAEGDSFGECYTVNTIGDVYVDLFKNEELVRLYIK